MENVIKNRKSCRAFTEKPVERKTIENILDTARWAPSGVNHQPVHVAVLGSDIMKSIGDRIVELRKTGTQPNPDYDYYPKEWREPYKTRRKECGLALYRALNIPMEDKDKREKAWERNYYFFHAPMGLIVYMEKGMATGSWIDVGMFIQNILLTAQSFGLATCPQAALAEYPDVIRQYLNLTNVDIVCGIALGYQDNSDIVNSFKTKREEIDTFTRWYI